MTDKKQRALEMIRHWGWYEWTVHTNFSFLMGASYPHEYLERALSLGYRGIGVSDLDGVYGLARTHRDLKRILKKGSFEELQAPRAGFKLFYGMELHLASDHHLPMVLRDTLILIAQSREGYARLCRLGSEAHRLRGKSGAYLTLPEIQEQGGLEGIVAIQPMRGVLRRGQTMGRGESLRERFQLLCTLFPGRFYLALSCHLSPAEDLWQAPTLALGRELGLPFLLDQDVFFHEPRRKMMSDLLQSIRQNIPLDQAVPFMFTNQERSFKSLEALAFRYGSLPVFERALQDSARLADGINWSFDALAYRYPREMLPLGQTAQGFLTELVWDHARQHYGDPLPQKVTGLLEHELQLIETLNFADYFLTVWDIVRWARSQGILCQGRGSAANSAVCFVLGVTSVDPMLFDLLFERFMSVERGDPPDIDVDFEHERREEVIQYIYQRYGRHKAAMVANVITFRTKGSIRAVGKALGVSDKILSEVSQRLEFQFIRRSGSQDALRPELMGKTDVPSAGETHDEPDTPLDGMDQGARRTGYDVCQRALAEDKGAHRIPWKLWWDLAEELKGFPRHLGIHSGGFMLADEPLDRLVAQEPATMEGRSVVQWSKEDIEGLGFFKIDILALGMLSALQKGFQGIKAIEGREFTLSTIPQEDPATYAMIQRADTVGTFQIESRAQMSMLPRLRPRTFYDLVVEVAIIRPGPIQGGMIHPYLRRREGLDPVVFPDERLRPILARTLGIPLFQEQVMRIAMAVGGFSPGEANELRRHMGAWSLKGDMGPWLTRLAEGMRGEGIAEEFVQGILGQMRGFAHYGFPESHAVSFALIAYASSWMKCHYPAVFYMALLNSQPMGFYTPHSLVQAAQRQGVKVLPISVQHSQWDSSLEGLSRAEQSGRGEKVRGGSPPLYGIRLGLREVRSLRKQAALEIIRCREKGGSFSGSEDFLRRVSLYRHDMTALAAAGTLSDFGLDRRGALWLAEAAPFCPHIEDIEPQVQWPRETSLERIQQDYRATGISLGTHPVRIMVEEHWCYKLKISDLFMSTDLLSCAPGRIVSVFGMVLVRQSPPSAHGMVFITMEDEKGFFNLVLTPQCYQQYGPLLETQAFLCVRGRLQRQGESHSLLVIEVYAPQVHRASVVPFVQEDQNTRETPSRDQKVEERGHSPEKAPLERYFDTEVPQGDELVVTRRYH